MLRCENKQCCLNLDGKCHLATEHIRIGANGECCTYNSYSVYLPNEDGSLKDVVFVDTELEAAKIWIDRTKKGLPAPSVWRNGQRIAGY